VLDLSNNRIEDIGILDVLEKMPNIAVLQLQGNPVVRKISQYRKTLVSRIKSLTYLDDRPVFEDEKRCAQAWFCVSVLINQP
jgi:dynein assembly factor 1, axonemal